MRKIIYVVLFLNALCACNREQKPLEILPMMAEDTRMINDSLYAVKDYPLSNHFYLKDFKDNKRCIKELLQYIKDTMAMSLTKQNRPSNIRFYRKNKGAYFEHGEGYVDQEDFYYVDFVDSLGSMFQRISTPSKYKIWHSDIDQFPKLRNYEYNLVIENNVAIVSFGYREFNTDVWQKFLNVVFYDRKRLWWDDYRKYDLWKDNMVLSWHNWSAPTKYTLLNPHTQQIECVIEYPLVENYDTFTMEIL